MWDAIKEVLMSDNAWFIVLVLILVILIILIIGIILLLQGKLIINSNHFSIGTNNSETERNIIRQQTEWAKWHCDAFEKNIPKVAETDSWRVKYILEKIYDEIVDWICFNHIVDNPSYVGVKQDKIVYLVQSMTTLKIYHTKEFEIAIREDVEFIIKKLIEIRKLYK